MSEFPAPPPSACPYHAAQWGGYTNPGCSSSLFSSVAGRLRAARAAHRSEVHRGDGAPVVPAVQDLSDTFEAQYEVLNAIGTGSYATVRACRRRDTGEMFAVKCFTCKDYTPKQREFLRREVTMMQKVGSRYPACHAPCGAPAFLSPRVPRVCS